MDRATLDAHDPIWGSEDKPLRVDLHRLTPEESALYDDLRDNCIRAGLRLEQEHIGFYWLISSPSTP
ncbi:Wadjet anti-phage system protein JetD domain-containing protein [Propionivibrio sp.]|uniref:Wadjet anti-phage system protein JetD domain-containing protein n=1 Tax=Propionivibrio sp. TaxID=2212460 RepID=UPI00272E03D3|nr:Wadjet anti-phage system protein JetD domain-containing protein [Propionivibrio sp.]